MKNKNLKISGLMLASVIVIVSFVYAINVQPIVIGNLNGLTTDPSDLGSYSYNLRTFSSYKEFTNFLNNCSGSNGYDYRYIFKGMAAPENIMIDTGFDDEGVIDYSETNIQVEGVDEPDIVKTDGKYIYIVSGSNVFIVKAFPAEDAEVVTKISVDFTVTNIFINGDRLVLFGNLYNYYNHWDAEEVDITSNVQSLLPAPWYSESSTIIKVYDIEDREEPDLVKDIKVGGRFFNARMIGDHVYVITTQYSYDIRPIYEDDDTIIPQISINGEVKKIPLSDIYCIDVPSNSYTLTHVVSVNIKDDSEEVVDKIFTLGNSQTMYVSKNNIYLTYQTSRYDYHVMQEVIDEVVMPLLPDKYKLDILHARSFDIDDYNKRQVIDWILESFYETIDEEIRKTIETEIHKRTHRTKIHKISVEDGKIEYMCNGSVPGRILNQFSMDEHNGFFRVATQIDGYWRSNIERSTNVYILDKSLDLVGSVENIAPSENMHSARFMGNRAYLVTFKNTDPFFTLDLSDPNNPKILGELKIPGYSDYLHPYDENHIIGVGKDAIEASSDFAWYQGLKIALFDVTDFENPIEVSKVIIGDRGTDSPALYDHKAFLFDKEKELLVLPVTLYEISEEIKEENEWDTSSTYGNFKFQGAYVYRLTAKDGFEFKGRITHRDDMEEDQEYRHWYWNSNSDVKRSLYIGDVLYTISNSMIKMNNLDDLSELNSIELN